MWNDSVMLACLLTQKSPALQFTIDLNLGSKFAIAEGAGRYQILFRKHEKLIWGAPKKIQGADRKGPSFKGSLELGAPLKEVHFYSRQATGCLHVRMCVKCLFL